MDNELLCCGIENPIPCLYSSLYLSIFLYFKAKFVSQFFPELCKLESAYMVYICRMRFSQIRCENKAHHDNIQKLRWHVEKAYSYACQTINAKLKLPHLIILKFPT